jgi:outer membrane lipoprotein-sorting protein
MNSTFKLTVFVSLLIHINGWAFSQPTGYKTMPDINKFKSGLNEKNKTINTIECDFVQEKNMAILSERIISKGHFYFKKANMLRWEYTEPYSYLIILNNNKVLVKDENKKSKYDLSSNNMFKEINNILLGSVQGELLKDETNYKPAYFENDKYYLIQLSPLTKMMKEYLKTIYIYFDKKDFSVISMKMVEPSDDFTLINFTSKKINNPILIEKFSIK